MFDLSKQHLFAALRDRAILRGQKQRLVSPNGSNNSWLMDTRSVMLNSQYLNLFAELFWQQYADQLPFQIGGLEMSAIPLQAAILMKAEARNTPISAFVVRKERKTYGAGKSIEGQLTDEPIVVVDDILNSGTAMEKVQAVLQQDGKSIKSIFVICDYHSLRGQQWRNANGITINSVFNISDFGLSMNEPKSQPTCAKFQDVWRFQAPHPNFFHCVPKSFPTSDGDRIYFGSDSGLFFCLDASTGKHLWVFQVKARGHKNIWSAPALHDNRVYFGSYDGNVYCLDAISGRTIWRFEGAEWVGSSPALAPDLGLLFIGLEHSVSGRRGSIVALSMLTGELVWQHLTKRYTHASPAYWQERQLVACGSNDDEMFLFDAHDGNLKWRFQTNSDFAKGSIRHAPAFDTRLSQVITGCANGFIYIIDVNTGQEVWSVKTANSIYTIPLVENGVAYVGSTDKHLYLLDLNRRVVRKKIYIGSKIFSPPRLIGGRIYFGACNGRMYEIDPADDCIVGEHQLGDAITNAIIFSERTNLFYALTYMNELYAFKRHSD